MFFCMGMNRFRTNEPFCSSVLPIEQWGRKGIWLSRNRKICFLLGINIPSILFPYERELNNQNKLEEERKTQRAFLRFWHSAARLVTMSRKSDRVTPLLIELHWLPVEQCIEFKVLLFTYKAMQGFAPQYLRDLLDPYSPQRSLRSASKLILRISVLFSFRTKAFEFAAFLFQMLPFSRRLQKEA